MNVIVAGASRGIGFETVKHIAAAGAHSILAISRDGHRLRDLEKACAEAGSRGVVIPAPLDLGERGFEKILLPQVREHLGKVDLLVYNAGYLVNKPVAMMDPLDFDRSFNVNVIRCW